MKSMSRKSRKKPGAKASGFFVEALEPRICPSALNFTTGATTTTLLDKGDTGTIGSDSIQVSSGSALVFVTDVNNNGMYDSGEITGIAVSDKVNLTINADITGDIVTNLNPDGTLSTGGGKTLLYATISGITVTGEHNISGDILAGSSITNLNLGGKVGFIATGTAATATDRSDIDFNGTPSSDTPTPDPAFNFQLDLFIPAPGQAAGSITHIAIGGGLAGMATGDGSNNSSPAPVDLVTGDFNEDGRQDIITVNPALNNLALFLGTGTGSFGSSQRIEAGINPVAIITGDFNGDTHADLAVANRDNNDISIFLGDGNGDFIRTEVAAGTAPVALVAGDFNGDTHADLAVANSGSNDVTILLNSGTGGFTPFAGSPFRTGDKPSAIGVGNFDGDAQLDIVTANESSNSLTILRGLGGGSFEQIHPVAATTGDLNNDGRPDLVIANDNDTLAVFLGNASGTFSFSQAITLAPGSLPSAIVIGNFDGAARADIVVANAGTNNLSLFTGNNNGTFEAAVTFGVGAAPRALTAVDFNGDNRPDLAVANSGDDNVSVLLNTSGTGSVFGAATNYVVGDKPISILSIDLDGDGQPDLVTANENSTDLTILKGGNDGTFDLARPGAVVMGNFNGDSNLDLLIANSNLNNLSLFLGDGSGAFVLDRNILTAGGPSALVAGDFDGDSKLDFAVSLANINKVSIYTGNGDGTFDSPLTKTVGTNPTALLAADLNGDSMLDLAVANHGSNSVSVLLNTTASGVLGFGNATNFGVGTAPVAIVAANFDGNTSLDLATANEGGKSVSILVNNGSGSFSTGTPIVLSGTPTNLAVGLFNADSDPDLVVTGFGGGTGKLTILIGTADATFDLPSVTDVGTKLTSVVVGDFDGSGGIDLVVTDSGTNQVLFLPGNNDGTFGAPTPFGVGTGPVAIVSGLFNAGTELDLLVANQGSNNFSVLLGAGAGAFGAATNTEIAMSGTVSLLGNTPTQVTTGLLNTGTVPDLVVSGFNGSTGKVIVLPGNGDMTFAAPIVTDVGGTLTSVALGDFNNDGKTDVAVSDADNDNVHVLLGIGDGTLGSATAFDVGTNPIALFAGNFNSGTALDLITINGGSANLFLLLGKNDGTFAAAADTSLTITVPLGFTPTALAVGSLNPGTDALTDLAVVGFLGSSGRLGIVLGNATGSLSAPLVTTVGTRLSDVVIGQFDLGNTPDLLATDSSAASVRVLLGNGDGTFATGSVVPVGGNPQAIVTGSFNSNADSLVDFAVVNPGANTFSVALARNSSGLPDGQFTGGKSFTIFPVSKGSIGGMISQVTIVTDTDGYTVTTGRGGDNPGVKSAAGGSITGFTQQAGSGDVRILTGAAGTSSAGIAANGGSITQMLLIGTGAYDVGTGRGGFGVGTGGNGGIINGLTINNTVGGSTPGNISVHSGNGGNGQLGFSGIGGLVTKLTVNGAKDVAVTSGNGGNGLLGGGAGGGLTGLNITGVDNVNLASGDGGLGVGSQTISGDAGSVTINANGGNGGDIQKGTIVSSSGNVTLTAGNGGYGINTAGKGGKIENITISSAQVTTVTAGDGGSNDGFSQAASLGGNGGSVNSLNVLTALDLVATAGSGGSATGAGGFAGSINGVTAVVTSGMHSELSGGTGASGSIPTAGGSVTNAQITGDFLEILGGNGGIGTLIQPASILAADLNGDGRIDLVTSNGSSGTLTILFGGGNGTFSNIRALGLQTDASATTTPDAIAAVSGDFNGDGLADLVSANSNTNNLSIFLGTGNGKFATPVNIGLGNSPTALLSADLNADGFLDLAAATSNSGNTINNVTVLYGDGQGGFNATATPSAFVADDVTGDGKVDLLVANTNLNNVLLFKGNGDGTFSYQSGFAVGKGPSAIVTGDFNGDSRIDVAVANATDNTVSVAVQNNDGTFAAPVTLAVGTTPSALVAGDFNADTKQDLAAANSGSDNVSVLLNTTATGGPLVFSPATNVAVGDKPIGLVAGDLNGGGIDLVALNETSTDLTVLLNNGSGVFTASPVIDLEADVTPTNLAIGHFIIGDNLNLVVTGFTGITGKLILLDGDGAGGFSAQPARDLGGKLTSAVIVDLNHDGRNDVVVTDSTFNRVDILMRDPLGGFNDPVPSNNRTVGANPIAILTGFFDSGDNSDVAVLNASSNSFSILLGNGTDNVVSPTLSNATATTIFTSRPSPVSIGGAPVGIVAEDFNGDGRTDLATANQNSDTVAQSSDTVALILANANRSLTTATTIALNPGVVAHDITAADVNNDEHFDLLVSETTTNDGVRVGHIEVLLGNGDGTFDPPSAPSSVVTGLFNHDSNLDLVIINEAANSVTLFTGHGDGTFTKDGTFAAGTQPVAAVVGNFDGDADNHLDLAVVNQGSNNVTVLLGDGMGGFATGVTLTLNGGTAPVAIVAGDFGGDSQSDLAVANSLTDNISLLINTTSGGMLSFGAATNFNVGDEPIAIIAADFNNDLKLDLATANGNSRDLTVLPGNGNGTFADPTTTGLDFTPTGLAAGFLDSDAGAFVDAAVVGYNAQTSVVLILLGNGDGTFTATASQPGEVPNARFNSVLVTNLDGGGSDIVVTDSDNHRVLIYSGNDDGTFDPPTSSQSGAFPLAVAVDQFNASGQADLVVVNRDSNSFSTLLGNGDGTLGTASDTRLSGRRQVTFGAFPNQLLTGNVAGDPNIDIVVSDPQLNNFDVLTGNGQGDFLVGQSVAVGRVPLTLQLADFNGDGRLDIATANLNDGNVSVSLNNGASFDPSTRVAIANVRPGGAGGSVTKLTVTGNLGDFVNSDPIAEATGDFNSDGISDLVVLTQSSPDPLHPNTGSLDVYLGNSIGGFSLALSLETGKQPSDVIVADLNGDNLLDIAVTDAGNDTVEIFLFNSATGNFRDGVTYSVGSDPRALVAGDFGGSSAQDLAVANFGSDTVSVLINNGNGTFATATTLAIASDQRDPVALVSGNLDGANGADLVVLSRNGTAGSGLSVFLRNASGGFANATSIGLGDTLTSLAIGQLNSDTNLDLVAVGFSGSEGRLRTLLGDGTGGFTPLQNALVGTKLSAPQIGEFNGGGVNDLMLIDAGHISLALGNGAGSFGPLETILSGNGIQDLAVVNFSSTGPLDLAALDATNQEIVSLISNGDSSFDAPHNTALQSFGIGFGRMGGIAAGVAGSSSSLTRALNGDVISVTAEKIAAIVAGGGTVPAAANFVDRISANEIGRDLNGNEMYDFADQTPPNNGVPDVLDTPIDGLILTSALGQITDRMNHALNPPALLFALITKGDLDSSNDTYTGAFVAD